MRRAVLTFLCAWIPLVGCGPSFDELFDAVQRAPFLSTGETSESTGSAAASTGEEEASTAASDGTNATSTGEGEPDAGETRTGADESGSGGLTTSAAILAVDMPAEIKLAGPVPFTVTTEHATAARARLDGVELGPLQHTVDGVFTGMVAIRGSVDDGAHVLEVTAEGEASMDMRAVAFEVSTPAPGTPGWSRPGPAGSRARRLALTPAGDVVEVGPLVVDGLARPAIRKRSPITGAELWPETVVLDAHEGAAEDVVVAPDGRIWVALNVRVGANQWRPRIVLLDEDGQFTGIEAPTEVGQTVRGIDGDGDGGCVGVGDTGTGYGDTDVVVWHVDGDGVPVISGLTWDYVPTGSDEEHVYMDLASDVIVAGGVAWLVATSIGKHEVNWGSHARGLLARMDIDAGVVLAPVIIAPVSGGGTQSMFLGGAAHPDGLLVAGTGCDLDCVVQRYEVSLYTAAGARAWFHVGDSAAAAYASGMAFSDHGVAVIAVSEQEGQALRGKLLGRVVGSGLETFTLALPASMEASELTGVVVDGYHRAFASGYRTLGGVAEARVLHVHQ